MNEKKFLGNIDVASLITIVSLICWIGINVYGCLNGYFDSIFDFFKQCFLMVISFYIGTTTAKKAKADSTSTSATVTYEPESVVIQEVSNENAAD